MGGFLVFDMEAQIPIPHNQDGLPLFRNCIVDCCYSQIGKYHWGDPGFPVEASTPHFANFHKKSRRICFVLVLPLTMKSFKTTPLLLSFVMRDFFCAFKKLFFSDNILK